MTADVAEPQPCGRVIAIVGPTASGKSALAEEVAVRLGSAVVSVDAMQVYRGMDIGTAKEPASERRCPLAMVDVCDPDDDYSVQRYQHDARACIDRMLAAGLVPVLCGGTGLYLDAVIDEMGFPAGTNVSAARLRFEKMAEDEGADAVYRLLEQEDPESAALIHPHNVRRVIRALEMHAEGVSYAEQNEKLHHRRPHYDARIWALARDREELYRRIDARVDQMIEAGLVDEVRGLAQRGLAGALTSRQAIGYKEILDYLDGSCSLDEAVALIKQRSRRYAKRQISWIRRDGRARWLDMDRLTAGEAADAVIADWNAEAGQAGGAPAGEGADGTEKAAAPGARAHAHDDAGLEEAAGKEIHGQG